MRSIRLLLPLLMLIAVSACEQRSSPVAEEPAPAQAPRVQKSTDPNPATDLAYVCPMDTDVRSAVPGTCPRCGMKLVAGIPDPVEFHLDLKVAPTPLRPNEPANVTFEVFDPWKDRQVKKFSVVHEKLFHAFVVSRDLQFFLHDHPVWKDGVFTLGVTLPKPGMYRVLGDFYPEAATPQLLPQTIFVTGAEATAPKLTQDYTPKQAANMTVGFAIYPESPTAGAPAQMRFTVDPGEGLEKYLGAWGHMLAASDDLIDMIHTHPSLADGQSEMQFNLVFPRPHVYRIWVQFQRHGVVNTAHFDVAVKPAPPVATN